MNEILQQVADTVTDKPVRVTVDIKPQNKLQRLLQRARVLPKSRSFLVTQITAGNLIRISGLLVQIPDYKTVLTDESKSIYEYGPFLLQIAAYAFHNKKSEPPESLVRFIETNITSSELAGLFSIIIKQMHVQGFLTSIILIKGVNLMEMSQKITGELIAPGEPSKGL